MQKVQDFRRLKGKNQMGIFVRIIWKDFKNFEVQVLLDYFKVKFFRGGLGLGILRVLGGFKQLFGLRDIVYYFFYLLGLMGRVFLVK